MDAGDMRKITRNIEYLKTHFESSDCQDEILAKIAPSILKEIEKILLSQDARMHSHVDPAQHYSALYQASRLVATLERSLP